MIGGARARGLDVSVEGYPYGAGMTDLKSSVFNPGWQQKIGVTEQRRRDPRNGRAADGGVLREVPGAAGVRGWSSSTPNPDAVVDAVITDP
jgi:hypothetical protein